MLKKNTKKEFKVISCTLDDLVPKNHLLRKINSKIDFSFIYDKVNNLYSPTGRPSIDPVVLVKIILLSSLYNIDSERKLLNEIQVNLAYRWFLGIDLDEKVPDRTSLSKNRNGRFRNSNLFQEIFDEIVRLCIKENIVAGKLLLTDSTHIKANASKERHETILLYEGPNEYNRRLDLRAKALAYKVKENNPNSKRNTFGGDAKSEDYLVKQKMQIKSTTDPETGYLGRTGKPKGFHYLNHQSQDSKYGIITDVYVTPGNVNDFIPYIDRLKVQKEKFGFKIEEVAADTGYDFPEVHWGLDQLKIKGYISKKDTEEKDKGKVFPPSKFKYDEFNDIFICPNDKILRFTSVNTGKYKKRSYAAKHIDCQNCSSKDKCSPSKVARRIDISFDRKSMNKNYKLIDSFRYTEAMTLRRIYCEGNFGIMKENHNLRKTRKRGIKNVLEQCLFSALALNIKKLIKYSKGECKAYIKALTIQFIT
jgi:transposase